MSGLNIKEIKAKLKRGDEMSLDSRTQRYLDIMKFCGEYRMMGFYPNIEAP